jgi:hypothetical protein
MGCHKIKKMKGKLIKTEVNYLLEGEGGVVIASTSLKKEGMSLSLKNCQAIEFGYDLDELFNKVDESIDYHEFDFTSFRLGIETILELMGDKKFSEEQLREAFFHVQNEPTFDVFKQSLQQTQWDVEVVMVPAMSNNGNVYYGDIPKLDSEGCLTLKRI